jgi:hypothetical protein
MRPVIWLVKVSKEQVQTAPQVRFCLNLVAKKPIDINVVSGDVKFGMSFDTPEGVFDEEDGYALP